MTSVSAATAIQIETKYRDPVPDETQDQQEDIEIAVADGAGLDLPLRDHDVPATAGVTFRQGATSCAGKLLSQAVTSGIGAFAEMGIEHAMARLVLAVPGGALTVGVIGGTVVAITGFLAGKRGAELFCEATGAGVGVQTLLTIAPAVVPLMSALGVAVVGGSAALGAASISATLARRFGSLARDGFNELFAGTLPEVAAPDSVLGGVLPAPMNVGIAIAGDFALGGPMDRVGSGFGKVATAAVVKGAFAASLDAGRMTAACVEGKADSMKYVPARWDALADNLREPGRTLERVGAHTGERMLSQVFSADMWADVHPSPGVRVMRGVCLGAWEARGQIVRAGLREELQERLEAAAWSESPRAVERREQRDDRDVPLVEVVAEDTRRATPSDESARAPRASAPVFEPLCPAQEPDAGALADAVTLPGSPEGAADDESPRLAQKRFVSD